MAAEKDVVQSLLAGLRVAARAEASEMAEMPPGFASPLSAAEREAIVSSILVGRPSDSVREPIGSRQSVGARVPGPRRARFWVSAVLLPLSVAAAVILLVSTRSTDRPSPLPAYEITVNGGLKELRGAEAASPHTSGVVAPVQRVLAGTELVIVARPATAVAQPIAVRAFVVGDDGVREVDARAELAPSGSARLRFRLADGASVARGPMKLKIVVGAPKVVRNTPAEYAREDRPDDVDRRWLTVPLQLVR